MIYRNRQHAAEQLAIALDEYRGLHPLVLAIPRGAVVMGRRIAEALEGELDVVLVRKLGAPGQPELAIGAVDEQGEMYLTDPSGFVGLHGAYLREERSRQLAVLRTRRRLYTPDRPPIAATGRIAIVLDDGVATGSTMIAALRSVRAQRPKRLIAAAAVMPPRTYCRLGREADHVVCLQTPPDFYAVGQFFEDFSPVSDHVVIEVLRIGDSRSGTKAAAQTAS